MGTTSDKLLYLQDTKSAIKDAIVAKGVAVPVGTPFREYATKIGTITTGSTGSETADTWVRPSQWLALPANVDGVQKVSILNAVFDTDSEFVAFRANGNYTVDWGDGLVENFNGNTTASHKYDYSNANLNSDTVTTFGYKQCIITITPQAGQNLTAILLNYWHPTIGTATAYDLATGFLDIRVNSLLCTNLQISTAGNYVKHTMLEQCLIGELADTTLNELFYDCYALQSVSIKDTSNVTSFTNMHYNNYALQKMPTYTFRSAGVDVSAMFFNCYSLRETYPLIITPSGTNALNSIFYLCKSLRYVDLTIVSNINYSLTSIFSSCVSLEDIKLTFSGTGKITGLNSAFVSTRIKESPAMDTSLCTNFGQTFQYCDRLTNLYAYNYSSATTLVNMLDGCYSLKTVPNFNITASCTNLSYLCNNCWSLEKAPTFSNSSGVTNISYMLAYCKSITNIPSYVFGTITTANLQSFVQGCESLQYMPSITVGSSYTSNTSVLLSCCSLKRMLMPLRFTFSVANAKMSATALNEMYSILPTVTGQTVTVTGNYGTTTAVSINGTTTAGSNTVLVSATVSLAIGKFVTGVGITTNTATNCTFTDSVDLITSNNHGLINGNIISFSTITSTTGISIKTIYYVVNATTNTFQISDTAGGMPIALTTDGTGSYITPAFITSITPNTSITLSTPCVSSGTNTLSYFNDTNKTYIATMKGWTVTI